MITIQIKNNNKSRRSCCGDGSYSTTLLPVLLLICYTKIIADVSSFHIESRILRNRSRSSSSSSSITRLSMLEGEDFINGSKIPSITDQPDNSINSSQEQEQQQKQKIRQDNAGDLLRVEKSSGLLRLAKLSLQDYEMRSGFFKKREADRRIEESLARMMGDEASYVRPMDASEKTIGPLGLWEKSSVEWFQQVIDEEARRAREIVRLGGISVRPMDTSGGDEQLGPLGIIESRLVDFFDSIQQSERERSSLRVLRPKDLEESKRGPLGKAELRASEAIREILNSEKTRMEQSRIRDGIVRPIDIPGPLGELEMAVLAVVKGEEQRKLETQEINGASLIRPKDSKIKGPLGELEEQAVAAVKKLTEEEKMRVRNIQKFLDEHRPMEQLEPSALGMLETVVVGIVRAPILLFQILSRVRDLLQSDTLDDADANILKEKNADSNEKK